MHLKLHQLSFLFPLPQKSPIFPLLVLKIMATSLYVYSYTLLNTICSVCKNAMYECLCVCLLVLNNQTVCFLLRKTISSYFSIAQFLVVRSVGLSSHRLFQIFFGMWHVYWCSSCSAHMWAVVMVRLDVCSFQYH